MKREEEAIRQRFVELSEENEVLSAEMALMLSHTQGDA